MPDRRGVLSMGMGLAAMALPGCSVQPIRRPSPVQGIIDAHVHLFNGRDIPVFGFLQQVDLSAAQNVPGQQIARSALVRFLVSVLRSGTPSARDEMGGAGLVMASARSATPPTDEQRLAAALAGFQSRPAATVDAGTVAMDSARGQRRVAVVGADSPRSEDEDLLAAIAAAAEVEPAAQAMQRAATSQADAARIAAATYEIRADGSYIRWHPLIALIRWVMMLTRPRRTILADAVALYGGPGGARIMVNQIVDFELWFKTPDPDLSPVMDQVMLMDRIAREETGVLVLNFVPFCPMRAIAGPGDALGQVRRAVMDHGCAGVKLYPPLGFRPTGNAALTFGHTRHPDFGAADGAAMDRALAALYAWCAENDVPILSHASPTMAAGPGGGADAAPPLWRPVLAAFPDLRVNLAHVGGFHSHVPGDGGGADWAQNLAAMLDAHPNLFFDCGFLSEADRDDPGTGSARAGIGALLTRSVARERMMYASDWSMIARMPDHPRYLPEVQGFLADLLPSDARTELGWLMGGNARRWLGLDRHGAQYRRLAARHAGHPVWNQMSG